MKASRLKRDDRKVRGFESYPLRQITNALESGGSLMATPTHNPRLHILTGAPGTGKTAILNGLRARIRCVDEPAREVLAHQRSVGGDGLPDRNPSRFVDLLLRRSIDKHAEARAWGCAVLFDRGVPDCIAYARYLGTDPTPSIRAAGEHRYDRSVLVLRPWAEIYGTDDERKMTFEATLRFQRHIDACYREAGYQLVEVPRGSIQDRVEFILTFIGP